MAIFVRINPRQSVAKRFRCGIEFGSEFQKLEVDKATRTALEADPYLEVSETVPAGFVEAESDADAESDTESDTETSDTPKNKAKKGAE